MFICDGYMWRLYVTLHVLLTDISTSKFDIMDRSSTVSLADPISADGPAKDSLVRCMLFCMMYKPIDGSKCYSIIYYPFHSQCVFSTKPGFITDDSTSSGVVATNIVMFSDNLALRK